MRKNYLTIICQGRKFTTQQVMRSIQKILGYIILVWLFFGAYQFIKLSDSGFTKAKGTPNHHFEIDVTLSMTITS